MPPGIPPILIPIIKDQLNGCGLKGMLKPEYFGHQFEQEAPDEEYLARGGMCSIADVIAEMACLACTGTDPATGNLNCQARVDWVCSKLPQPKPCIESGYITCKQVCYTQGVSGMKWYDCIRKVFYGH